MSEKTENESKNKKNKQTNKEGHDTHYVIWK